MSYIVSDLTALRSIGPTFYRIVGYPVYVQSPGTEEEGSWYVGVQSSASEFGNIIVTPNDNPSTFRWLKTSNLVHYSNSLPSAAPPIAGITWVATLTGPTRRVTFISTGTSSVADWKPRFNAVVAATVPPVITPAYVGQLYDDRTNRFLYTAEDTVSSSSWSNRTVPDPPGSVGGETLIASWDLDAVPWVDTINGFTLTAVGSVSVVGDSPSNAARIINYNDGDFPSRLSSPNNALFQTGDNDWRIQFEVKFEELSGSETSIIQSRAVSGATNIQWEATLTSDDRFRGYIFNTTNASTFVTSASAISVNVWYIVELKFTASSNQLSLTIDGGTPVTATLPGTPRTVTNPLISIGEGITVGMENTFRIRNVQVYRLIEANLSAALPSTFGFIGNLIVPANLSANLSSTFDIAGNIETGGTDLSANLASTFDIAANLIVPANLSANLASTLDITANLTDLVNSQLSANLGSTFDIVANLIVTADNHPDVTAWVSNVNAAGGSVQTSTVTAMNAYLNGCQTDGILTKLSAGMLLPLASDGFAGVFTPLYIPATRTITNRNFVSGDYSLNTGLDCGSTNDSKRLDTSVQAQEIFTSTAAQVSVYINAMRTGRSVAFDCRSADVSTQRIHFAVNEDGIDRWETFNFSTNASVTVSGSTTGLTSGIRTSSTFTGIFRNGTQAASKTTIAGSFPTGSNLLWFAATFGSGSSTFTDYSKHRFCYLYAGPPLTSAEEALHVARVQTLQTALGRNV